MSVASFARRALDAARRELTRVQNRYGVPRARLVYHAGYRLPEDSLVDGRRGERVLAYLAAARWLDPASILRPPPLRVADLLRVHTADYLSRLDDPAELERLFGGRPRSPDQAARALAAQRWATAGTVHATLRALKHPWIKGPVVNLGGGFHHARRDRGAGFCAFNDVAVALDRARAEGFTGRVLVVDLDAHHGDGTRSIFSDDERVTTFSMHGEAWDSSPALRAIDVDLGPAVGDVTYLKALDEHLPEAFARARPALVFYVAGVDVADGDPLGGFRLTPGAIAERDQRVFARCASLPTVMVLAGGYGPDAWRHTARTLVWLLSGQDRPIRSSDERALSGFRQIRRSLAAEDLRGPPGVDSEDGFGITEADIFADLVTKAPDPRLLGYYSAYGLEVAFERYGLLEHLRARGYDAPEIVTEPPRPGGGGQGVRVYADRSRTETLIELVVDEVRVEALRMLSIEWLLLQDPRRKPTADEPLLPGQKHPSLGCLRIVVGMLVMACERLGFDGLSLVPAHFHVAAQARRLLRFLDPAAESFFLSLSRATAGSSLAEASLAIAAGRVVDRETGRAVAWKPSRMVLAVSPELLARLDGPAYARAVEDAARATTLKGTRTVG